MPTHFDNPRGSFRYHAAFLLGVWGCGNSSDSDAARETAACADPLTAPQLVLVDTVVLAESDSVYLGNPAATFTSDGVGRLYIPDMGNNRLLRFSPAGELERVFGRPGRGPGEFTGIGYAALVEPGRVWQSDYRQRRISLFDTTGQPIREIAVDGRLSSLHQSGATIWAGLTDHGTGLAVARIDATAIADSIRPTMISVPSEYDEYPVLSSWDDIRIAAWADTLVLAFGGVDYLVRYDTSGSPMDTAWVPTCRRQGSPTEILGKGFRSRPRNSAEQDERDQIVTKISGLLGMWRLTDGHFLVWYQDPRWDAGRILRSQAYLSVLSPDLSRACVDAQLSAPGSGRTHLSMVDDLLLLLDQVVSERGASPEVRSVVRRYRIDTTRCRWLETSKPGTPVS